MIRTVVCEKEGCTGNSFYIRSNDNNTLTITCNKCESTYDYELSSNDDLTLLSNCSSCNSENFKIFKDVETNKIYAKCVNCGNPPERVYVDVNGNQVSYNEKLLNDVKEVVLKIDQRICNLEKKIGGLENGQVLLEESLAYATKFLTE